VADEIDDSVLIGRSRAGDREAFAAIVRRYQGLVCAITYSGTGDVGLSEEIAQETFLNVWRGLGQVKDTGRFRQWLCQIARNAVRGAWRRRGRDVLSGARPLTAAADITARPDPAAEAREQRAMVWRALGQLPEEYREPLVLYYRQGKSVRQVAEGLDISEDTARQRLSRGRKMLKVQVETAVERSLSSSGPGEMFSVMVLAAIAATGVVTATASAASVAAKGMAAATKTAAGTTTAGAAAGVAGGILGAVVGLGGAILGTRAGIVNTKSPRERRFMIRMSLWLWGAMAVLMAMMGLAKAGVIAHWVFWTCMGCFFVLLGPVIVWANRRQRRIRVEDGTWAEPVRGAAKFSLGAVVGSFAGGIFGPVAWIVPMSVQVGKWWMGAAAVLAAAVTFVLCVRACRRARRISLKVTARAIAAVGAINLAAINLLLSDVIRWQHATRGLNVAHEGLVRVVLNVAIVAVIAAFAAGCAVMERRRGAGRTAGR